MLTSAQVVETSVTNNSSFQNYTHPDDHTTRTIYGLSCWTLFGNVSDKLDPWLVVSCDMNKHPNTKEPVIPMGIVNYILLIVLRLLNVYFRLIFRSLDPLILKFVGPPTHVTKITYFSFPSMLKT